MPKKSPQTKIRTRDELGLVRGQKGHQIRDIICGSSCTSIELGGMPTTPNWCQDTNPIRLRGVISIIPSNGARTFLIISDGSPVTEAAATSMRVEEEKNMKYLGSTYAEQYRRRRLNLTSRNSDDSFCLRSCVSARAELANRHLVLGGSVFIITSMPVLKPIFPEMFFQSNSAALAQYYIA
ncbi:hypothetical protein B0H11DRAFT_1930296 [Mycena galericulata]|nr:hypothetical protein B0H11DRAFT_1930296 [Mycena galericulata]